jgi:hypothetical protein
MPVTVSVNNRTVVHKDSGGKSIAGPDVCLTPCGPSVVPVPYPNMARSADMANGAKTVFADGNPMGHEKSYFSKSTGDEAGSNKGVSSGTHKGIAEFMGFSFDVSIEGKGVVRAFDQMIHNNRNTPPTVLLQPPAVVTPMAEKPVIPQQDKVEVAFHDVFGEPMEGLAVTLEMEGEKMQSATLGRGQVVHVTDKDNVRMKISEACYAFRKMEE